MQGCNATLNELYSNTGGDSDKVRNINQHYFSPLCSFFNVLVPILCLRSRRRYADQFPFSIIIARGLNSI